MWFLHEFYSDIKVDLYTIPQFRLLLTGKVSRLKIRQHRNPPKFSSGALKNFQLYGTIGGSVHVFCFHYHLRFFQSGNSFFLTYCAQDFARIFNILLKVNNYIGIPILNSDISYTLYTSAIYTS